VTPRTPVASASDILAGRAESDAQDFLDEQIGTGPGVSPFADVGIEAEERAEMEALDRSAEDLLLGLRALQGGEEIRWKIERVGEDDARRNGFLDEVSTASLTQKWLRDKFGGGMYRIRGHYPNGKYAAQRTVRIAGDAKSASGGAMTVATSGGAQGFNVSELLAQMQAEARARREEEMERRRYEEDREEKRSRERLQLIAAIATPAATVLAAVLGNKGPDMTTLIAALKPPDTLTLLSGLKSLMPEAPPVTPQPDMIDKTISIMEKIEAFKGNPNGETNWLDVVKEVARSAGPAIGPVIGAVLSRAQAAAAARAAQAGQPAMTAAAQPNPQLPAPPVEAPAVADHPSQETADMNLLQAARLIPWLKGHIEKFLTPARRQSNPEIYAALLLEELPEDQDPALLLQFVERPDWFEGLKSLDSRVAQFPGWFQELRTHLIAYIREEEPPAGEAPASPPTAAVPVGRHAGTQAPVVHIDGGSHAPPKVAELAPKPEDGPPSLLKGGA
jgi:hypothetical protein